MPSADCDGAASTCSSPESVSSTPSAGTAMSVLDRVRLLNSGKKRMLQVAAAKAEVHKEAVPSEQCDIQQQPSNEADNVSVGTYNTQSTYGSSYRSAETGAGRPGKLKVPPAFLTGGAGSIGSSSVISPLSMDGVPAPSRKEAMLLDRKKKLDAAIKPTTTPATAPAPAQESQQQQSTALAHGDERRKLQEKRRRMRQKIKATQQLQHQMVTEAAERNRARTEIVAAPSDEADCAAPNQNDVPASEGPIECIFKDDVAPTEGIEQPKQTTKPPTPPLPSQPLRLRADPYPVVPPTNPPSAGGSSFANLDPTSPPRVTRSPMSGLLRPTIDDSEASALPSLELSPIRASESNVSEVNGSNEAPKSTSTNESASESPSLRSRRPTSEEIPLPPTDSTPTKCMPPSCDNTPKTTNKAFGGHQSSPLATLAHPVTVLPKDLPSGKPRKKPAGLPLSPHSTDTFTSTASATTSESYQKQSNPFKASPTKSLATNIIGSEKAHVGVASPNTLDTPACSKPESVAQSSVHADVTAKQSDDVSGDSLLSWLGAQSDNETATSSVTSREEGILKNVVENLEHEKEESLTANQSSSKQSVDVISEGQPHQAKVNAKGAKSSKAQHQKQLISAVPVKTAGIGSFMTMLSSAVFQDGLDGLDGVMEVVAGGVEEVGNITTSFLEGHGRTQQNQARKRWNVQKANAARSPSPGNGPIQIEISRSFNPRVIAYDNDENNTVSSKVSALTFESYEDYASTTSMSPARASSFGRRTPRGLQMDYGEDKTSTGKVGGKVPTVKEEETWQPLEKERRFFA